MKLTKKIMIAGAGVVVATGIGAAAFAFITNSGSGGGSANVTTTNDPITFDDVVVTDLLPGVTSAPITVIANNPNAFVVRLGPLKITNVAVKKGATDITSLCPIIVSPDTNGPYPLAKSTATPVPSSLRLTLDDTLAVNQNNCIGANVTFDVAADALP